jgi:hypothetical protein
MLPCPACELLSECHRNIDDRICPCGFCIICCEDLCRFYGTNAIHWHQDSSLCECSWSSDEDQEDPALAAAAGEGTGNDEDFAQRIIDALVAKAADMTQAGVAATAGEDALYWIDHASHDGDKGVRHRVCRAPAARVDCWLQFYLSCAWAGD